MDEREFSIDKLKDKGSEDSRAKKINNMIKNALKQGWTVTKKNKQSFELIRKKNETN